MQTNCATIQDFKIKHLNCITGNSDKQGKSDLIPLDLYFVHSVTSVILVKKVHRSTEGALNKKETRKTTTVIPQEEVTPYPRKSTRHQQVDP